jgi:hypothetical protein
MFCGVAFSGKRKLSLDVATFAAEDWLLFFDCTIFPFPGLLFLGGACMAFGWVCNSAFCFMELLILSLATQNTLIFLGTYRALMGCRIHSRGHDSLPQPLSPRRYRPSDKL